MWHTTKKQICLETLLIQMKVMYCTEWYLYALLTEVPTLSLLFAVILLESTTSTLSLTVRNTAPKRP
jgi:hypothetical protein